MSDCVNVILFVNSTVDILKIFKDRVYDMIHEINESCFK